MNLSLTAFLTPAAGDSSQAPFGLPPSAGASPQAATPEGLFSLLLSGRLQLVQPGSRAPSMPAGQQDPNAGRPPPGQPLPLSGNLLPAALAGATGSEVRVLRLGAADGGLAEGVPEWFRQWLDAEAPAGDVVLRIAGEAPQAAAAPLQLQLAVQPYTATGEGQDRDAQAVLRLVLQGAPTAHMERALGETVRATHSLPAGSDARETPASVIAVASTTDGVQRPGSESQVRAAAPAQLPLDQPVGQRGWDQALGSRILWMTNDQLQNAQLKLNPPHLGPLEVRLSVQQDQSANVAFVSHHAAVRDAVEAAIPRLREMMAEAGVSLSDVNISGQSHSQAKGQTPGEPGVASKQAHGGAVATDNGDAGDENHVLQGVGLVDYFV